MNDVATVEAEEVVNPNKRISWGGEYAWDKVGHKVPKNANLDEFLKSVKMDWSIDRRPMMADMGEGKKPVKVPGKSVLMRSSDNKVLTVASDTWKPLQPKDAYNFMNEYARAGGVTLDHIGELRDGRIIFALAKLKKGFEVTKGDKVEGFMLFRSPNYVGSTITSQTLTVREVCKNGLHVANEQGVGYRQNHLQEFDFEAARESVAKANEALGAAERRAKTIAKLKLNIEDAIKKVLLPVFAPEIAKDKEALKLVLEPGGLPKKVAEIVASIKDAPGAIENNGWGVLNGVTHWADHVAGRTSSSRLTRVLIGDHGKQKLEVESRLIQLAGGVK